MLLDVIEAFISHFVLLRFEAKQQFVLRFVVCNHLFKLDNFLALYCRRLNSFPVHGLELILIELIQFFFSVLKLSINLL